MPHPWYASIVGAPGVYPFAEDRDGNPIFLAQSAWWLGRTQQDWPKIKFYATRERA